MSEQQVITAEVAMQSAQEIAILAGLVRFIGVAQAYGVPMMVQLQLADPKRTNSVVSSDILLPVLADRAKQLLEKIESAGINCTAMLEGIEQQLEASKQNRG